MVYRRYLIQMRLVCSLYSMGELLNHCDAFFLRSILRFYFFTEDYNSLQENIKCMVTSKTMMHSLFCILGTDIVMNIMYPQYQAHDNTV